jgi:hypothetical protein
MGEGLGERLLKKRGVGVRLIKNRERGWVVHMKYNLPDQSMKVVITCDACRESATEYDDQTIIKVINNKIKKWS